MIAITVDDSGEERGIRALLDSDVANAFRGRFDYRVEFAAGDADAQVEAVLDVLAPKSEAVWFTDQDPAERVRVPIFYLDYQGQPVTPNHDQLYDVARAIVTAIRTATAPAPPQTGDPDHAQP